MTTRKSLIGAVGFVALAGAMLAPVASDATLVHKTVFAEEFGYIT